MRFALDLAGSLAGASARWPASAVGWASGRALSPDSLYGVSLLLACCAAAWFSGGAATDYALGIAAVAGCLLASFAARALGTGPGHRAAAPRRPAGHPPTASTDWLTLPGAGWSDEIAAPASRGGARAVAGTAGVAGTGRAVGADGAARAAETAGTGRAAGAAGVAGVAGRQASGAGYLRVAPIAAEYAIYGGIAAGGKAAGWSGMWQLAAMALIVTALRDAVTACASPAPAVRGSWRRRLVVGAKNPPGTARVLIAVAGLAVHGARVAIFAVLAVESISLLVALAGPRKLSARPGGRGSASRSAFLLAARDDGALVRWAGRLVQGNLFPLPPALAGLTATALLALLGMGNLHGIIALTPPVVMLLAAPGASHPHDGKHDWLVPVILQAAQYLYLATLGFAWGVPGPLSYSLCALTAVWYATLTVSGSESGGIARPGRTAAPAPIRRRSSIGWEARLFIAGISAILGLATFTYFLLAAYLGVLICRKILVGYAKPLEENRR